jgi:hypothetical protein
MSLNARAILLDGRGYGARLLLLDGRLGFDITPPVPTPSPGGGAGGFAGLQRKPFTRHLPRVDDDDDILLILSVLSRENMI